MATISKEAAAVRERLDAWVNANRALDIDAVLACYAPEATSFDCHSVFRLYGPDDLRRHLEACYPHMDGPMTLDIRDLSITAGGGVGFAHFAMRCGARGRDGQEHWCWLRGTACLREIDGQWLIVHDHCSAPFDPMSNTAMLDAGPGELKQVA
jgi:ketosteroid isomerase-like protein